MSVGKGGHFTPFTRVLFGRKYGKNEPNSNSKGAPGIAEGQAVLLPILPSYVTILRMVFAIYYLFGVI